VIWSCRIIALRYSQEHPFLIWLPDAFSLAPAESKANLFDRSETLIHVQAQAELIFSKCFSI
jgi:hypothetical protein